jgi:hypothetical protein
MINIYRVKNSSTCFQCISYDDFFITDVQYNIYFDKIVFKKVDIDMNKRIIKPRNENGMYRFTICGASEDLSGKFEIEIEDEELIVFLC